MLSVRDLFPNDDPGPEFALHLRVMARLGVGRLSGDDLQCLIENGQLDNTNDPARVQSEACGY